MVHEHKSVYYLYSVEFKPPQLSAQCFENGTACFNWSSSPDQNLSETCLNYLLLAWHLSGNCSYENGTNPFVKVSCIATIAITFN